MKHYTAQEYAELHRLLTFEAYGTPSEIRAYQIVLNGIHCIVPYNAYF
jgi:hypothetical protein